MFLNKILRLQTRPPNESQQPITSEQTWRNNTLLPVTKMDIEETIPVAPPRKKRPESFIGKRPIKNGFKDVFASDDPRRFSLDSIKITKKEKPKEIKDEIDNKNRIKSISSYELDNDEFTDFSKEFKFVNTEKTIHLPKVGNKKSDKFFGENLSDLSDEIYIPPDETKPLKSEDDNLDKFLESVKPESENLELKTPPPISPRKSDQKLIQKSPPPIPQKDEILIRSPPPPVPKRDDLKSKITSQSKVIPNQTEDTKIDELQDPKNPFSENYEEPVFKLMNMKSVESRPISDSQKELMKIEEPNRKEKTSSLDRKAEFLLGMLNAPPAKVISEEEDELFYLNKKPIEEPLCEALAHKRGCICCDDEKVLQKFLKSEISTTPSLDIDEAAPKKPDRDFSKYRKTDTDFSDLESAIISNVEKPTRINKKSISREDLPSPPPRPKKISSPKIDENIKSQILNKSFTESKKSDLTENKPSSVPVEPVTPQRMSRTPSTLHRIISMPTTEQFVKKNVVVPKSTDNLEVFLRKCSSSNSFLTQDIMDDIVKKAYGFDLDYWNDEHYGGPCDGSSLVSPISKLQTRKISTTKKPDLMDVEEEKDDAPPSFSIGSTKLNFNKQVEETKKEVPVNTVPTEIIITKKVTEVSKIPVKAPMEIIISEKVEVSRIPVKIPMEITTPEKESKQEVAENSPTPVVLIPRKKKSIPEIEAELNKQNVEDLTHVLDDIYKKNHSILEDFQHYLEDEIVVESLIANINEATNESQNQSIIAIENLLDSVNSDSDSKSRSEIESTSSDDSTDTVKYSGKRRDSIDDMDRWFSHNLTNPLVNNIIHGKREGRRGSEGMISSYNTGSLFPFGKRQITERSVSESEEFFENSNLSKSVENLSIIKNTDGDHSKLLKILENEKSSEKLVN